MRSTVRLAVFFAGLPGSGKTTIAHRTAEALGESCSRISSEEIRKQHGLEDLLQVSGRLRLQTLIAEKTRMITARNAEHIVVDANRQLLVRLPPLLTRFYVTKH